MEWVGILGVLLVLALVFGFYLGVPMKWGKHKDGGALNAGHRNHLRKRERQEV